MPQNLKSHLMEKNPRKIFHLRYLHRSHIKSAQMNLFALYGVRDIKFHHFTGCFAVPLIFSSRKSFAEEFDSTSRQIFTLPYYLSDVKEIHNNPKKKQLLTNSRNEKFIIIFPLVNIYIFFYYILCVVYGSRWMIGTHIKIQSSIRINTVRSNGGR